MKLVLLVTSILLWHGTSLGQTSFYFDEPFKQPAKLPKAMVPLLRDVVNESCHGQGTTEKADLRSWFVSSRITLNRDRLAFIVRSSDESNCPTGVDNVWFWVFLKTTKGYRRVLSGGTLLVDVLRSKSHGLHDIETNVATARTNYEKFYRFDGTVYKLRKCMESTPVGASACRVERAELTTTDYTSSTRIKQFSDPMSFECAHQFAETVPQLEVHLIQV